MTDTTTDPASQGGQPGTTAPAPGTNTPATAETPAVGTAEGQTGGTAPDGDPDGQPGPFVVGLSDSRLDAPFEFPAGVHPDDPAKTAELTFKKQPRDGDTVSFGETTVTFRSQPTELGEILIGATLEESRDAFDAFLVEQGLPFTAKITDQGIEAEEFEVIDALPFAIIGSAGRVTIPGDPAAGAPADAKEKTLGAMGVPAGMIGQHPDNQRTPDDPVAVIGKNGLMAVPALGDNVEELAKLPGFSPPPDQRPPEIEVINTPGRVDVIVGGPPTIDVEAEKASAGQPLVEMKIDPSQPGDPGHQQLKTAMENAAQESARLKHAFTEQYPTYLGWFDRVQRVAQFDGRPVPEPTARWKDAYDQCLTPEQAVEALGQRKA